MRQFAVSILCVLSSTAITGMLPAAGQAAGKGAELIPEDTCIVELTLPEGATVTVDGEDYGAQRKFVYERLTPKTTYEYEFVIHYPSGETSKHAMLLEGGRRVRLAKRDPVARVSELGAAVRSQGSRQIGRVQSRRPDRVDRLRGRHRHPLGTRGPAGSSARSRDMHTVSNRSRSARTAGPFLPVPGTRRRFCGMRRRAGSCERSRGTPITFTPSRSVPTAGRS